MWSADVSVDKSQICLKDVPLSCAGADTYLGRKWHCISVTAFRGITVSYWEKKLCSRGQGTFSTQRRHTSEWITTYRCVNTNFLPLFPARSWHILGSNNRGDVGRAKGQEAHSVGFHIWSLKQPMFKFSSSIFLCISFLLLSRPCLFFLFLQQFAPLWKAVWDRCCEENKLLESCVWQKKQPARIAGSKALTCSRTAVVNKTNDKVQTKSGYYR